MKYSDEMSINVSKQQHEYSTDTTCSIANYVDISFQPPQYIRPWTFQNIVELLTSNISVQFF